MSVQPFIGKHPQYDGSVFIAENATVIGDVVLGEQSSLWFNAVVRGDVHHIRIGARTNIQDLCMVHVTHGTAPTTIGDDVTVGHGAILHGCTIQDRVLIGMSALVMDHAVVGHDSIVGAKALVTGRTVIPPRSLVLGAPARVVRELTEDEVAFVKQSARNYVRYRALYLGEEQLQHNPYYDA